MSFGIAPPVTELTNEIRQNHDDIIQNLGVDPSPLPDSWDKIMKSMIGQIGHSAN